MAFNNLSVVLLFLDRMEEAELCCREALAQPGNAAALNNLGKVLSPQGKLRAAPPNWRASRPGAGECGGPQELATPCPSREG